MRYYPLLAVNAYVAFGVIVSFFGPLQYVDYQKGNVFIYISIFLLVFSFCYYLGIKTRPKRSSVWSKRRKDAFVNLVFRLSLGFAVVFLSYEFLNGLLLKGLSFRLSDVGSAYISSYDGHVRNSGSYSWNFLFLSIGSLPIFIAQTWSVLYFNTLSRVTRMGVLYTFAMILLVYTIGTGKQKQLGDILVIVSVAYFMRTFHESRVNVSALAKAFGFMALGIYGFLFLLGQRYQSIGIDLSVLNDNLHHLIYLNQSHPILSIMGDSGAFPLTMLSGYLGQGYYGLSLAFNQPFTWTYFGGSSYSFSVILNRVFGTEFLVEQNYPYLVGADTGWSESKWHTVFAWLASDLTFPGVIFFLGVVGFFFARTWKEALYYRNPFSALLFALMAVGAFYIPANNQLMHSPGGLFTLVAIVLLYARFARRFNFSEPEIVS